MGSSKFACEDRHATWNEPCQDPDGFLVGFAVAEVAQGRRVAVSRRAINIASFLVRLVMLCRGTGQSFSSSPTGLADGFGLEKEPYDKSRFTPGLRVGPRLRTVCPD